MGDADRQCLGRSRQSHQGPGTEQGRDHGEWLSSLEAEPVAGTQLPALDWVITCRPTQTGKSLACIGNLGSSTVL